LSSTHNDDHVLQYMCLNTWLVNPTGFALEDLTHTVFIVCTSFLTVTGSLMFLLKPGEVCDIRPSDWSLWSD